ncbi:MAG: MgtC/SapB family protein [Notoacmeibacter sp.]|nr:MgtC/SapB family protein [Notoacmeibacter sp.]
MPEFLTSGSFALTSAETLPGIALRLVSAVIAGAVLGLERELRDRPAGLKTHMLISLASATFALIAINLVFAFPIEDSLRTDPVRLIEAVTAGVAFIAAGAIISQRDKIRGLTTGASLWLAGAIGACCGCGFFGIAGIATGLAIFIMIVVRWVEHRYM